MQRFPFEPPRLERFVDPDEAITETDRRLMAKAIDKFEKRFPQITVSVCVTRLPPGVDGREFGFWYLNRSRPRSSEERARRPHHLLLTVDRSANALSATVGYGLDCFLDDVTLAKTLTKLEPCFAKLGYAKGISRWFKALGSELVKIHEEAVFAFERWERRRRTPKEKALAATLDPQAATQGVHVPRTRSESPPPDTDRDAPATVGAGSSISNER